MSGKNRAEGQCYCGSVKFYIDLPADSVINCHCNMCRNLSGNDYSTWVAVLKEKFHLLEGDALLQTYQITDHSFSRFCKHCGTRVIFEDEQYPTIIGILRGILDHSQDLPVTGHFFVDHKAPWFAILDDMKQHGGDSGFESK